MGEMGKKKEERGNIKEKARDMPKNPKQGQNRCTRSKFWYVAEGGNLSFSDGRRVYSKCMYTHAR